MIFKPSDPFSPPHGRIDGVIYWGVVIMPLSMVPVGFDTSDSHLKTWTGAGWVEAIVHVPDAALSANVPLLAGGDLTLTGNLTVAGLCHFEDDVTCDISLTSYDYTSVSDIVCGGQYHGDGSLLTGLPIPPAARTGSGSLDGSGQLDVSGVYGGGVLVAMYFGPPGAGMLYAGSAGIINSTAGFVDSGKVVNWIAI